MSSLLSQYDVIVVGGGLSGLRTARDLVAERKSVLVLEAQDRLGGRVYYDRFADTEKFVEYGGGWFNPEFQQHLAAEIERYSLPYTTAEEPPRAFRWHNAGKIHAGASPVPLANLADLERGLHRTIQASSRIEFGAPWDDQDIADLDISWEKFVRDLNLSAPVEEFFLTWCSSSEPEDTNALDILSWIAAFDDSPWRLYGESMVYFFVNGTKSLVDALAADSGAEIRLNSPVARLEQNDEGVVVTTRSGERFTAVTAVVALPINIWPDIAFEPPLSALKREVSAEIHPGRTVKVWAVIENGPEEGLFGWGRGEGLSWLWRFDRIPEGDLYIGFSGGHDLDPTDRDAIERAARVFAPEAKVTKFDAHDWRANEFLKGTWMIRRPGEALRYHSAIAAREGRIVFGGSDTCFGWNGWMNGALETGARAAQEALKILATYSASGE